MEMIEHRTQVPPQRLPPPPTPTEPGATHDTSAATTG
jgi:hypothetical protein